MTRWSIDEESAEVPDGTHATAHECSFSKKIDHTSKTYEPKTVCVLSEGMTYEISAHGNEASIDTVMNCRNATMQQRAAQPCSSGLRSHASHRDGLPCSNVRSCYNFPM